MAGTAISFGVPIFAALLLGWYGAGGISAAGVGPSIAIVYWLAILIPTWLAFEAATWALAYGLRSLNPPFLGVVVLGCIIGGLAARPFVVYIIGIFISILSGEEGPTQAPSFIWSVDWLLGFVQEALVILLLWVGANMLMHGPLALPRFGYTGSRYESTMANAAGEKAQTEPDEPEFLKRLKAIQLHDITALEAEDHYVRVHSADRSELIHYRFADAVDELRGHNGLQVHRSFWVSKSAIQSMVKRGRSYDILIGGEKRIPVGQTFKQSAATELKDHIAQ